MEWSPEPRLTITNQSATKFCLLRVRNSILPTENRFLRSFTKQSRTPSSTARLIPMWTEACYAANAVGVENLALAAKHIECGFVTVSTDYVFDGAKSDFYTQRDTPRPPSVYGQAKLEGEIRARNAYARSIIVRSGWIYGAGGRNFLCVISRLLAEGKTVKVIADAYGTPTFAKDLVKRLREAARLDLPCLFHVTNSGAGTSYEGFARKICELKGFDTGLLEPVSANTLKRPAPRPASSKLACLFSDRLGLPPMQHWEKALAEFLSI